ncbi:MAG: hypothetical protein JXB00_07555 [Bacteroidales bacterium]|nr:hypothetical protein [Bacteroidales bacterium]
MKTYRKKCLAASGAIGGWNLSPEAIFSGTKSTANGFSVSGITLASDGSMHSPRFYVNADGSVGIRSNTTGKRIELNSADNNIKFYNSSNQLVAVMDDGIEGSNAGVYFGYNSPNGGYQSLLTNYALALIHNQYTKIRLFYDDTIDKAYVATESGRSALYLHGTADGYVEVVFHGLPRSSSGLQPGQVYLDGSGYLRALAPSF